MADLNPRTVTVKPDGGGDYVSLNAALAGQLALYPNLTVDNGSGSPGVLIFECYASTNGDTTAADTGTGWTTSATCFIRIIGAASEKTSSNTGKWSTERYRLIVSGGSNCLSVREQYSEVIDIQAHLTIADIASNTPAFLLGAANCRAERCIAKGSISGSNSTFFAYGFMFSTAGTSTCINCLAYDFINAAELHGGFYAAPGGSTASFYNCTAYNCNRGYRRVNDTCAAYNCGAAGCTTPFSGTWTQDHTSTSTPTFVNAGAADFHLAAGDTTWKDAGDGASPKSVFTNDVDGQARPATDGDWDIGFDEYVSGTALAWGEENPDEQAQTWQQWHDGDDAVVTVSGDPDWGACEVATGAPVYGPVVDTGNEDPKTFTVTKDKYASGSGAVTISIRGSTTSFSRLDGSPSWTTYTEPVQQSWRYVQVKMETS